MGPEGHRFPHKINTLADGSPTRFLRILSYGLANLRTMNANNYRLRDIADVAAGRQELPGSEWPKWAAGSTDRCNTLGELLCWRLVEQGLSRSLVELPRYGVELGLAVQG